MYQLEEGNHGSDQSFEDSEKFWELFVDSSLSLASWGPDYVLPVNDEAVCPSLELRDVEYAENMKKSLVDEKNVDYNEIYAGRIDRRHSISTTFDQSPIFSPCDPNMWTIFETTNTEGPTPVNQLSSFNFEENQPHSKFPSNTGRRHSVSSSASCSSSLFLCPWNGCGKSFNRFYNLRSHYRTHTLEKPFVCSTCDLCFARNHDLKRHERIHSDQKPFVCDMCDKGFSRSDALLRHRVSETCLKKAKVESE